MRVKPLAVPVAPIAAPKALKPLEGISAPELVTEIGECQSISSLMALMERHAESMNHIHITAALSRAAKMADAPSQSSGGRALPGPVADAASSPASRNGSEAGPSQPAAVQQASQSAAAASTRQGRPQEVQQAAQRLAGLAAQRLGECTVRELATITWSLGKLGHVDQQLMNQVMDLAGRWLGRFKPQETSNLAWGLAVQKLEDEPTRKFFKRLMQHARPDLSKFAPREQAAMLWSLATLRYKEGFFERYVPRAAQAVRQQLGSFGPHELSVTLWSLATLQCRSDAFLEAATRAAMPLLPVFTEQALSNVAWSLATLNYQQPAFVERLLQEVVKNRAPLSRQSLCNTMWALSILDHNPSASIRQLVQAACDKLLAPQPTPLPEQLRQVHQYLLTMEEGRCVPPDLRSDERYKQLRDSCQQAWTEGLRYMRPSECQGSVLKAVQELPACAEAALEQPTEDGMFMVDIAVKLPDGTKVCKRGVSCRAAKACEKGA